MIHDLIFKVMVYSHFFKITDITPAGHRILNRFSQRFVQRGLIRKPGGRFVMEPIKVWASATKDRRTYRFHINALDQFKAMLKDNYITDDMYDITLAPLYTPVDVDLKLKPNLVLRDYQVPVVNYILSDDASPIRLVALATGRGKGICSMSALATIKKRVVIIVKPAYVEKWVDEMLEKLDITLSDLMTVKGSDQLKGLIELANTDKLKAKIIIISNRTFINYIKDYELDPQYVLDAGYGCVPDAFLQTMSAGVKLVDEVHQDAHANFKIDLFTHVEKSILLSATFISDDPFIEHMYEVMCPKSNRYREDYINRYIHSNSVSYSLKNGLELRYRDHGSTTYSHNVYEQSIIKRKDILKDYLLMINSLVEVGYVEDYKPGDKVAIFASSIHMCTIMTEYFKRLYPHLDVRRYVEDDPYENLIDADIRVTTILSGGTAHDIPGLTCTILTVAVSSIVSNRQTFGRLREIKGRMVKFYYLLCNNIPRHIDYHDAKKIMLAEHALTFKELAYPKIIGA